MLSAVLAGALGFSWQSRQRPDVAHSLKVTPLTSYPGLELHPSFAPDGNQFAFAWDGEKQDNLDTYSKVVGSDRSLRLTFNPARRFPSCLVARRPMDRVRSWDGRWKRGHHEDSSHRWAGK